MMRVIVVLLVMLFGLRAEAQTLTQNVRLIVPFAPGGTVDILGRLLAEHLTPTVPYGQGVIASDLGATAMLDVSDGLLADLGHVCERSGVGIDVDTSLVAIHDAVARVAAATGKSALGLVLTGGEDHALAATFPHTASLPEGWVRIGTVAAGDRVTVDGRRWEGAAGWDHFG